MTLLAADQDGKVSSGQVKAAVLSRFALPEWYATHEVTLGRRRLDVVAVNMWAQRSHRIIGVEVKVSRADFRAEVRNWDKNDEWNTVVDQFYIAAPKGIVPVDELPQGWGLLELVGRGAGMLRMKVRARTEMTAHLPREVAARFLTRAIAQWQGAEERIRHAEHRMTAKVRDEIRKELREEWTKTAASRKDVDAQKAAQYDALMAAVGTADWWERGLVSEAVAVLKAHRSQHAIQSAVQMMGHTVSDLQKAMTALAPLVAVFEQVKATAEALKKGADALD
jgi:hypothetical protein